MSTRTRLSATLFVALIVAVPTPSRGADPTPPPAPPADNPAGQSVHAEMLASHEGDAIAFTPGDAPAGPAGIPTFGSEGTVAAAGGIAGLPNGLFREVLGYLPYWMLEADELATLDYSLLSTVAYFSVGAQPDGTLAKGTASAPSTGWGGWTSSAMTGVINQAHARDVKVVLTVTMMAWNGNYTAMTTLLNSAANRGKLATEIAAA